MNVLLAAHLALAATGLSWINPATVQPRQQGVCVTEWTGGERVEIPVEVLGVLDQPGPERAAVLVRLIDDRFTGSGVVAGMSGSPVYIDGKLLGAVAFGWAFAKQPLAGITPFTAMRELRPGALPESDVLPRGTPATLPQLAGVLSGSLDYRTVLQPPPQPANAGPIPLALAGLPTNDFARALFASAGMTTVPAGARVPLEGMPEAGEMIAAMLIWGDASVAAGGTVTARDGDHVYAFGHPLFALGGIRMPAARARTIAVQESYQSSFKIFGVGAPFGTFITDRAPGILAVAGEPPPGIPVTIRVDEPLGTETWRFRIAEVPIMAPLLVAYLTNASLTARGAAAGDATTRLALDLAFADGRQVSLAHSVRGMDALARAATFAGAVVSYLENSPFPKPALSSVDVRMERLEQLAGASIVEAIPSRARVLPGEEIEVAVRLAPHQQPEQTIKLKVRVPENAPPGPLDLIVADGVAWSDYRLKQDALMPRTFADQLTQLRRLEPSSTLVAALETRDRGVSIPGGALPSLPPSYAATLTIGLGRANVARLGTAAPVAARWTAPFPLQGALRIALTVRDRSEAS